MSDRTTEIREELAEHAKDGTCSGLLAHLRAYADLLGSDPLIIQRDENGEWGWPEWAMEAASIACRQHMDGRSERHVASDFRASVMLDALAAVVDTPKEKA